MNEKAWEFWLTLGSLMSLICCFLFIMFCVFKEQFMFKKEYCIFLIPVLIYFIFQFIVNYSKIIENDRH